MAPLAMQTLAPERTSRRLAAARETLAKDDTGVLNISAPLAIVGLILSGIVAVIVVANLFPTFMDSLAGVNEKLNDPNTTTGDETADSLMPVFSIVIGIAGLLGIVAIILGAIAFGKKHS